MKIKMAEKISSRTWLMYNCMHRNNIYTKCILELAVWRVLYLISLFTPVGLTRYLLINICRRHFHFPRCAMPYPLKVMQQSHDFPLTHPNSLSITNQSSSSSSPLSGLPWFNTTLSINSNVTLKGNPTTLSCAPSIFSTSRLPIPWIPYPPALSTPSLVFT